MIRGLPVAALGGVILLAQGPGAALGSDWAPERQSAQLAPNGAPGVVKTVAYAAVDFERPIMVTALDDDEVNLAIKARIEDELRRAGRAVAAHGSLRLSFETKVIAGRFVATEGDMGRFEANSGGVNLQLNIWSTSRDSLLGGRQKRDGRQANVFHMNATLRDQETGRVLWQGDAFCAMLSADTERIGASMVAPLIANLGRTTKDAPFHIE